MIGYRTQLIPRNAYVPILRDANKPDHLRILDLIIFAAKGGGMCPSNQTICERLNAPMDDKRPLRILKRLEADGLIHLFRAPGFRGAYVIDLGIFTRAPANGRAVGLWAEWSISFAT